jgi:hypothetical protein
MNKKPAYPKGFVTPEGRAVSIRAMAKALKFCHSNPDKDIKGWNWFPTQARFVTRDFMRGLHDRINQRGAAISARAN